jgi:uncharacterized protein YqgV (UPF0045/DUF77 family)
MNQRTAVCNALISVLTERGVKYELNGETPIKSVLTEKDLETVNKLIFAGFRKGEIEMSADAKIKYADDKKMSVYVSSLINNWVRKAPEFNNDSVYAAKNPGSRKGSGDEQVKTMKALLGQTTNPDHRKQIEEAIAARIAEIKPTQVVEIDSAKLPESLRYLVK